MTHKTHKRDWGFTLVELLIVITIIGLLSALILVGLGRVRSLGRDTRRIADLKQVQNGLEIYFNQNQEYPNFTGTGQWGDGVAGGLSGTLVGAGIGVSRIPLDPLNRAPFIYQYSSASPLTGYALRATLENNDNPALRDDIDGTTGTYTLDCGPTGFPEGTSGTNSFYCTSI